MTAPRRINHLGIAVRTLDEGLAVWRDTLGLPVQQVLDDEQRGLRIAFLPCGETMIELLAPLREDSDVSAFLDKRGPGVHHVCLEVGDLAAACDQAVAGGAKMLGGGPTMGAEGFPIRFAHPQTTAGTLVELLEKRE